MNQINENNTAQTTVAENNDLFDMPSASVENTVAAVSTEKIENTIAEKVSEQPFRTYSAEKAELAQNQNTSVVPAPSAPAQKHSAPQQMIHLQLKDNASLGMMLRDARNAAGVSIETASQATFILSDMIRYLEADQMDRLPALVFVRGYVFALADYYRLDQASRGMLEDQLKELEPVKDVPEELLENIGKTRQVSEEEAKRLRMYCIYGAIIFFLLISLTVTSIIAFSFRKNRINGQTDPGSLPVKSFETQKLEKLLPPQVPDKPIFPVPAPAKNQ